MTADKKSYRQIKPCHSDIFEEYSLLSYQQENYKAADQKPQSRQKAVCRVWFTKYFYKYQEPEPSEKLAKEFQDLENQVRNKINKLF